LSSQHIPRTVSRRSILAAAGGLALTFPVATVTADDIESGRPSDPKAAMNRLLAGNARFVKDETRTQHVGRQWRAMLTKDQHPYATILSCSDSRVPPELVFDEGFGDLFVIRVAGNVIADDVMGSLSYAAEHLNTQLFVVMGHEGCGAVTAAVDALLGHSKQTEHIESLLKMITPGLKQVDLVRPRPVLISAAVEANVRWSMHQVARCPEVGKALGEKRAMLIGGVYDLETGRVRLLEH
jgi:carbonic anhydrase